MTVFKPASLGVQAGEHVSSADLLAWRDRHFGKDAPGGRAYGANRRAADALGLPLRTFLKQLYGVSPVSRQTQVICEQFDAEKAKR